jgi:hypothetical protein
MPEPFVDRIRERADEAGMTFSATLLALLHELLFPTEKAKV